jgi:hypothetical protein
MKSDGSTPQNFLRATTADNLYAYVVQVDMWKI